MKEGIKHDKGKNRLDLIPISAIEGLGDVLTYGSSKYGDHNWKEVENGSERYYAALLRHLFAYRKGEIYDPETGLHHMKHVLANAAFILELDQCKENISRSKLGIQIPIHHS